GAGPLSLARASRAQTARTLLVSTTMKVADIAFAAGFSSVRQFNETIGEVFAMTPSALRATARHPRSHASTAVSSTALTLNLPYREPFDPGVFGFLAVRAIPGIEQGSATSYARALRLAHGDARFRVDFDAAAPGRPLALTIGAVDLRDLPSLLSRVRRLLDLDADPVAIDGALGADPRLSASIAAAPGIRMPGAVDPQELLIRAMIGQQVTVAAARTALIQLSAAGSPSRVPGDGLDRLFPSAAQIAEGGSGLLRGPQRRIDSLRAAAAAMASGELDFGYGDDLPGLESKLLPLAGVGPWTVGYVAMRVIGAPDVFLANDAAVRNGIRSLALLNGVAAGSPESPAGPETHLSPDFRELSPWRSYATMHLWRAAAAAQATARKPSRRPAQALAQAQSLLQTTPRAKKAKP
ncbi:MAG TPA: AlkA N-terminal domain-containing protein, partial [Arthrobacter sp.]|nr:AlkA N-terminal domain-containing protein [Arthrobacter sp.]